MFGYSQGQKKVEAEKASDTISTHVFSLFGNAILCGGEVPKNSKKRIFKSDKILKK